MPEWRATTLSQLVKLQRGHDLPTDQRRAGSVPVVGAAGPSGTHDTALVTAPGVVVGRAGGSMGKATYCEVDFWPLNTSLYVTDFLGNDPRFAYYLLTTIDFSGFNSGAAQPMLNRNYITHIPIFLPKPAEQRSIAAVLGALEDKVAVNERIAVTAEAIMSLHFQSLGVMEAPSGTGASLSELIDFNPRTPRPMEGKPVYVDMAALSNDRASVGSWTHREPKSGTRFENGDTLLARITPCLENGKTGYVDFMEPGQVGIGSTEFIVMRSKPGLPSMLSYFIARSARFREHAIRSMSGSSGRQRVSAADAAALDVTMPKSADIARFSVLATATFSQLRRTTAESRMLTALRDTLLPKLMSGQITVRQAEKTIEETL
jgi:type I restriction enzyme, S subunit